MVPTYQTVQHFSSFTKLCKKEREKAKLRTTLLMQLYCDEFVFLPVAFLTPRATNWYFRIFWLLSIVPGITFIHNCCTIILTRIIMKIISLLVP